MRALKGSQPLLLRHDVNDLTWMTENSLHNFVLLVMARQDNLRYCFISICHDAIINNIINTRKKSLKLVGLIRFKIALPLLHNILVSSSIRRTRFILPASASFADRWRWNPKPWLGLWLKATAPLQRHSYCHYVEDAHGHQFLIKRFFAKYY